MSTLSKPVRQLAAVALLVAAGLALYGAAVEPAWHYFTAARERIAEGRVLLGRLEAATGRRGEVEELRRRAEAAPTARLTLKGDTEAIRLAALQTTIGEAASRRGVRVVSARALPAIEIDGRRLLGVRFDMRTDLATLQALLHGIETGEPMLLVHGLQLRAAGGSGGGAAAGAAPTLDAGLSVFGVEPASRAGGGAG